MMMYHKTYINNKGKQRPQIGRSIKKNKKMIETELERSLALEALEDAGYKTSNIYPIDDYNNAGINLECENCHHEFNVRKDPKHYLSLVTYVVPVGISEKKCSVYGGSRRCPNCKTPVKFACE